jgi:asparagine N-glycosylation enzyme membrane subunit Stt3
LDLREIDVESPFLKLVYRFVAVPFGDGVVGNDSKLDGREDHMLWTLALILLALWALGLLTGYTLGGLVHVLIVIAVIVVLFRIISGRRVL